MSNSSAHIEIFHAENSSGLADAVKAHPPVDLSLDNPASVRAEAFANTLLTNFTEGNGAKRSGKQSDGCIDLLEDDSGSTSLDVAA